MTEFVKEKRRALMRTTEAVRVHNMKRDLAGITCSGMYSPRPSLQPITDALLGKKNRSPPLITVATVKKLKVTARMSTGGWCSSYILPYAY
jgi:hypothetical protein